MKSVVFICLSPSVILPASMCCSLICLCFCPSLHLPLSVSNVHHFHKSVPLRLSHSLLPVPFSCHVKISHLSHCQICISSTSPTLQTQSEPILYRGCADTTLQYATKQCNHPGTPSSGCLPQFSFNEEVTVSFILFFFQFFRFKCNKECLS